MTDFCFVPVIDRQADLQNLTTRIAWHSIAYNKVNIHIFVIREEFCAPIFSVADGLDAEIEKYFGRLLPKLTIHHITDAADIKSVLKIADAVFLWQSEPDDHFINKSHYKALLKGQQVWNVDHVNTRMEGFYYIEAGFRIAGDNDQLIEDCKRKFGRLSKELGSFDRAFLLATGPSVGNYYKHNFDGAFNVICNSIILDKELMDRVNPHVLVFADPIFHFGPSQYAGTFRQALSESMAEYGYAVCVPFRYYRLLINALPKYRERIIGIPTNRNRPHNFDLNSEFELKASDNILTFLMIPLAATFAEEIGLLGCDGRPLEENSYFWSHNKKTQINDKMENIQQIHPGFFNLEYNDYYLEHCNYLEETISEAERQGRTLHSLAYSYIPALESRMKRTWRIDAQMQLTRSELHVFSSGEAYDLFKHRIEIIDSSTCIFFDGRDVAASEATAAAHNDSRHIGLAWRDLVQSLMAGHDPKSAVPKTLDALFQEAGAFHLYVKETVLNMRVLSVLAQRYQRITCHAVIDHADKGSPSSEEANPIMAWLDMAGPRLSVYAQNNAAKIALAREYKVIFDSLDGSQEPLFTADATSTQGQTFLGIDLTPFGGYSATGRVKEALFKSWENTGNWVWVYYDGPNKAYVIASSAGETRHKSVQAICESLDSLSLDGIYYRAVDHDGIHEIAEWAIHSHHVPSFIHIMDDWPKRMEAESAERFQRYDSSLRQLFQRAERCFAISQAMAAVFGERYQVEFTPFSNCVDPVVFPPKSAQPGVVFNVCYAGALADDMTLASIVDVATVIETLSADHPVRFTIYTRQPWLDVARKHFGGMGAIKIRHQVPHEEYVPLLQNADALLIAYNFDQKSINYIQHSMANKMPECLASGTPLIAYGPGSVATIAYLQDNRLAQTVTRQDKQTLKERIQELIESAELREHLTQRGRQYVFQHHNMWIVSRLFQRIIQGSGQVCGRSPVCATGTRTVQEREVDAVLIHVSAADPFQNPSVAEAGTLGGQAAQSTPSLPPGRILIGPYPRRRRAHLDETQAVRAFCAGKKDGQMIDVGAHEGYALMPFLNDGWHVFAFEPDNKNRTKLLERLTKHKNKDLVSLDTRCVSNKSQKGVSFFTSEQSTGISGLSAFHESHVEAQKVDITTLTEFFQDKPLPAVDFLKIDTEGHDLFVLQGFPWERGKPAVIECEFEDTKTVPLGYTFHDLARFLVDKGYTVYVSEWHPIIRYGIRHDWHQLMRYPCELADQKGWGNLLAFRDPIDEKDLVAAVRKVLKIGSNPQTPTTPATLSVQSINPPAWISSARTIRFSGIQSHQCFQAIAENLWRYRHVTTEAQRLWLLIFTTTEPVEGRTYTASIRLMSNQAATAHITLGRHGNTEWEGGVQRIRLSPGVMQSVQLRKKFTKQHQAIKVQLEIIELEEGDTVDLTIDALSLNESLTSIRQRIPSTEINLSTANRLFREKDYHTAMNIYLLLREQNRLPFSMYADNALSAARKLGITSVQTIEELLERME